MKVCMFVKNSFEYDARVTKEAKTLIGAGHQVTVVALHVPDATAERETTPDGIDVIRVPRVEFGLGRISRVAGRAATQAAVRESQITGRPLDEQKVRRLAAIQPPSTATPGADSVHLPATPGNGETVDKSGGARVVARIRNRSTLALISVARFGFRVARRVFGLQGRLVKTWAINRRMISVGLASGADVFHSHDLNTLWIGHVCKKRTGSPLVYDSHELATERNRMGRGWRWWATWNERRRLPSADALIVASPSWIDHNRAKYGAVPEPSVTVINVPELSEVVPVDVRSEVGLEAGVPLMLYQGSIQENRGIEPAIEAMELLPGVALVVVGYGYHRPALEDMAERLGLADRVKFFGPVPNHELLGYTASADIGLCNIVSSSLSYHTSLPNKLFEYLMAGVPVLGSTGPEIARVITETGAGEVADATDPVALADAAKRILADPEPYREGARRGAHRYHWAHEADTLLDVYRRIETG